MNNQLAVPAERAPRIEPIAVAGVLLLALVVAAPSLTNGFAYDDLPIIAENPVVQQLAAPWEYLKQGYWPPPGDVVYRPLTVWLFALQWQLGSGEPFIFHLLNLLFFLAAVILVYRLAGMILPGRWGLLAAAVFAVHPVHVEAVANAVGQAELNVTAATLLAVVIYLGGRRDKVFGRPRAMALAALLVWAGLAKEQGLMVPLFLGAAELLLVRRPAGWRSRVAEVAPVFLLQLAAGLLLLVLRLEAVPLTGGMQADAIRGAGIGGRTMTMLAVALEWLRLLFWPVRLQAEYGPEEINAATRWGIAQTAGLVVLLSALLVMIRWRSRMSAASFGVAWILIGLLPVSNFIIPTGIVLAERTMYLPSVGAALLVAVAACALWNWQIPLMLRRAALLSLIVLLAAASWLSATRQRVWSNNDTLLSATIVDAPSSYRAWWLYARHLAITGDTASATGAFHKAARLSAGDFRFWEEYGQHIRLAEGCPAAIPLFERALEIADSSVAGRSRLYYCLVETGDLAEARAVASTGVAQGIPAFVPLLNRADSLLEERIQHR